MVLYRDHEQKRKKNSDLNNKDVDTSQNYS